MRNRPPCYLFLGFLHCTDAIAHFEHRFPQNNMFGYEKELVLMYGILLAVEDLCPESPDLRVLSCDDYYVFIDLCLVTVSVALLICVRTAWLSQQHFAHIFLTVLCLCRS
jgi:hypothetical protein